MAITGMKIRKKFNTNTEYWIKKIENNIRRDQENNKKLKELGWTVIRLWGKGYKKRFR